MTSHPVSHRGTVTREQAPVTRVTTSHTVSHRGTVTREHESAEGNPPSRVVTSHHVSHRGTVTREQGPVTREQLVTP